MKQYELTCLDGSTRFLNEYEMSSIHEFYEVQRIADNLDIFYTSVAYRETLAKEIRTRMCNGLTEEEATESVINECPHMDFCKFAKYVQVLMDDLIARINGPEYWEVILDYISYYATRYMTLPLEEDKNAVVAAILKDIAALQTAIHASTEEDVLINEKACHMKELAARLG